MKNKIKNYSFWVSLSGAIVVLVEAIGRAVGFIPNGEIINDIIMAIAGVLVVFGVVTMPNIEEKTDASEDVKEDKNNENNNSEN